MLTVPRRRDRCKTVNSLFPERGDDVTAGGTAPVLVSASSAPAVTGVLLVLRCLNSSALLMRWMAAQVLIPARHQWRGRHAAAPRRQAVAPTVGLGHA